jgi:hydroxymethylpyrimidine pyrophosphatase-like HAD family hydrolase
LPEGATLHRTTISGSTADRLMRHFGACGYPVLALYDCSESGVDYHLVRGERNLAAYDRWLDYAPATVHRLDEWSAPAWAPVRIGIIDEPSHIEDTLSGLRRAFSPAELKFNAIYAPNYQLHVVECFAPQVNKWYGIQRVAEAAGISAAEVVTIGDDVNDLEMIRSAGLGVAMGNAVPVIREAARRIAPTNDEVGVAVVVNAVLNGECEAAA